MTPSDAEHLENLRYAVEAAENTLGRLAALTDFFTFCEGFLTPEENHNDFIIFQEATFMLNVGVTKGLVWTGGRSRHAQPLRWIDRCAWQSLVLRSLPTCPSFGQICIGLWDFWFDPAARWAVYDAYTNHPHRLRLHLARYSAHRRRLKLPVPGFTYEEFWDAWHNGLPLPGMNQRHA